MKNSSGVKSPAIIILSPKRSGSTALLRVLRRHSRIRIGHHNQLKETWEQNFWNQASSYLEFSEKRFVDSLLEALPNIDISGLNHTSGSVFNIWDELVNNSDGILVDKSPNYIGSQAARNTLCLIADYLKSSTHRKVIFVGLVRDFRDSVASEHEILWRQRKGNIQNLDAGRCRSMENLLWFQKQVGYFPIFRYEDLCQAPNIYFPMLLKWCEIESEGNIWESFRATSLCRYSNSLLPDVRRWRPSKELEKWLEYFGYPKKQQVFTKSIYGRVKQAPDTVFRALPEKVRQKIRNWGGDRLKEAAYRLRRWP